MAQKRSPNRYSRLQVQLPDELIAVVDDFRFAHRKKNRAEAIRELLKIGMESVPPRR